MPHDRFFIDSIFQVGDHPSLESDEAHHLLHVMRKQVGETIELVNGKNQLATATLLNHTKKEAVLEIVQVQEKAKLPYKIILCQAVPRMNRLETIIEKGSELGMDEIWLVPGQLSEKKELSPQQLKRLKAISISALKQSGRLDLANIILHLPLLKWKEIPYRAFFGDPSSEATPLLNKVDPKQDVIFFNGPESGFSEEEKKWFALMGVEGVSLHRNILRTDTAALAALTLLSTLGS